MDKKENTLKRCKKMINGEKEKEKEKKEGMKENESGRAFETVAGFSKEGVVICGRNILTF